MGADGQGALGGTRPARKRRPKHDITFRAIGQALSQWEYFEGNLSLTFSYLLGTGYGNLAALRAYGSVESFRGRANLLEHAAEVYFEFKPNDDLHKLLSGLLKDATSKFSARRNEIAHVIVNQYFVEKGQTTTFKGYVLYPAYYATRKRDLPKPGFPLFDTTPSYIYSSLEINQFGRQFENLANRAIEVLTHVTRHDVLVTY